MTGSATGHGTGVLVTSAGELRQAARALRGIDDRVGGLCRSLDQVAESVPGCWVGLAALEQAARTQGTRTLVAMACGPGVEAAAALERVAAVAEEGSTRVRAGTRLLEDALAELHRMRTLGVPPDVLGQEVWQRRVGELEATVRGCRATIEEAERDFDQAQRAAAHLVREVWGRVETAVEHASVLAQVTLRARSAGRKAATLGIAASGLWALAQARRLGDPALRVRAETMARARLKLIRSRAAGVASTVDKVTKGLPTWLRPPGVVGGPLLAFGQWMGAWGDLQDGNGYPGWRGETTKFFSAMAVVGIPASFVPLGPVPLAGVGMTASYSLWMGGNWIYDNRGRIVDAAQAVRRADAAVSSWVGRQVGRGYGSARSLSATAMDRLKVRAKELVTLSSRSGELTQGLRDRLRSTGGPLRLPEVRFSLPRLPVELGHPWGMGGRWWGLGTTPGLGALP